MRSLSPQDIYAESFRIIDAEVGAHTFDQQQWPIVRRMIHASGDLDLVNSVLFRHDAAPAGIAAFRSGAPVVTDVKMVAAGINKAGLADLGCPLECFIDRPEVLTDSRLRGGTRSYWAMRRACAEFADGVFVVGNAPTALLAICDAVRENSCRPRLIVAMPVGFVSVVESKELALILDIPVIAVRGRKGGSPLAAAATNALVLAALEGRPS